MIFSVQILGTNWTQHWNLMQFGTALKKILRSQATVSQGNRVKPWSGLLFCLQLSWVPSLLTLAELAHSLPTKCCCPFTPAWRKASVIAFYSCQVTLLPAFLSVFKKHHHYKNNLLLKADNITRSEKHLTLTWRTCVLIKIRKEFLKPMKSTVASV